MKNIIIYLILLLLGVGNISLLPYYNNKNTLQISIMDVGQGQGVLISYNNVNILIDTGDSVTVVDTMGKLIPFISKTLTFAIITHSHLDHYGAYFLIDKRYQIEKLLISRLVGQNRMYKKIVEHNPSSIYMIPEKTIVKINDLIINFIQLPPPYSNRNNSSIVTYILFHNKTFLITGDLEKEREMDLVPYLSELPIDYYVAGHHGSDTSSCENFLKIIQPQISIISAGIDNKFGHPKPSTLENLAKFSTEIYRTDIDGTVKILCKNDNCKISTQ